MKQRHHWMNGCNFCSNVGGLVFDNSRWKTLNSGWKNILGEKKKKATLLKAVIHIMDYFYAPPFRLAGAICLLVQTTMCKCTHADSVLDFYYHATSACVKPCDAIKGKFDVYRLEGQLQSTDLQPRPVIHCSTTLHKHLLEHSTGEQAHQEPVIVLWSGTKSSCSQSFTT